ncbi:hypothetical protein WG947_10385 [Pontibacter sp. H259]|uniref:hypothetical protein n=1 Tax=Pontibacter sp. H259 TaxID=3133421 RepID=UPI0030BF6CB3
MMKLFIVFASIIAIAFYFLRDQDSPKKDKATEIANDKLKTMATLPGEVSESSGIEIIPGQANFITHNDAGNQALLYEISAEGKLVNTHKLKLPNVDWEDISRDDKGNLYISDTGNNDNKRSDLAIYKVSFQNLQKPEAIRFTYDDQPDQTSKKDKLSFDSEATFWSNGNLYLITKDRNGEDEARIYRLTDQPGTQKAKKIGSIKIKDAITGASISPDGSTVALLSEEKIHVYRNVTAPEKFFEGEAEEIDITGAGQTEGITFKDNNTLILTSEGGNLYQYSL